MATIPKIKKEIPGLTTRYSDTQMIDEIINPNKPNTTNFSDMSTLAQPAIMDNAYGNFYFRKTLMESIPDYAKSLNTKDELVKRAKRPSGTIFNITEPIENIDIDGLSLLQTQPIASPKKRTLIPANNAAPIEEIDTTDVTPDVNSNVSITDNVTVTDNNDIGSQLTNLNTKSKVLNIGSLVSDASNYLREIFRGTSDPFVSANIQAFTPTPSQRDRNLSMGKGAISGEVNAMKNFMKEYGIVEGASGLLADEAKAMNEMQNKVALEELQRQSADAVRYDQSLNTQAALNAETMNKNMQKQAQENMISGQIMGMLQDRMYNTFSDMLKNEKNMIATKAILDPKNMNNDQVNQLLASIMGYEPKSTRSSYKYGYKSTEE